MHCPALPIFTAALGPVVIVERLMSDEYIDVLCVCVFVWCRLDDVAGQFNIDLVAAISNAVCPTIDRQPHCRTALSCRGKLPL